MKHSKPGNVTDLAAARLQRQEKPFDQVERVARECAELVCSRLTEMYGGPATLQRLERRTDLPIEHIFDAHFSLEWNGKALHRTVRIAVDDNARLVHMEPFNVE